MSSRRQRRIAQGRRGKLDAARERMSHRYGGDSDRPGRAPRRGLQPLIYMALEDEFGGLASPPGTDWAMPALPAVGVARVPAQVLAKIPATVSVVGDGIS